MSSVAERNREAYNKRVQESKKKTQEIKEKLARMKKKADKNKMLAELGVEEIISPRNISSGIKKANLQAEKEKDKIAKIKKEIKRTTKKSQDGESLVKRAEAGKSDDSWKKYSSISAAKKAGSLYYSKNGKKMAAVTRDMMKEAGYTSFGPKMLTKYMNERLGKTKKLSQGGALKPVPTGSQGKGLSKLPTPVRNKMGFMYGGGMPSKKPRVSNTDYRKASKGLLVISIDMMKKKGKGSKGKKKK
tara:strand:+ start:43 stop:777 length:735 start_codon:yes stop_codon:yes gene_type:complete